MSTPTFNQSRRILDFFHEVGATSEQLQNWLGAGDLQKLMLMADLSRVDRVAFKALLVPKPKPINWTPVTQYATKLREWNGGFLLGLTERQISDLAASLPDHAGPHQPTGISLTLGKGLQNDWKVVMQILKYELSKLGVVFTDYLTKNDRSLSYFLGSEPAKSKMPQLGAVLLDIGRFWDPENGIAPREVREQFRGQRLPALEVAWLMALNPQVFTVMDGQLIPFMWAPGLVVDSEGVVYFDRDADEAFVYDGWVDDRWLDDSVVVFREC